MSRRWSVAFLLFIQALLVGWIGGVTCPNRTEIEHIGATVYFGKTLRFDVFHVNPPLTRMVSGLTATISRPHYDGVLIAPGRKIGLNGRLAMPGPILPGATCVSPLL